MARESDGDGATETPRRPRERSADADPRFWRLIRSPAAPAADNMAIDEALMRAGRGGVVRFYSWQPPALSLGYFQRVAEVDRQALRRLGFDLVRRPTGGGAIAHAGEVTFCLAAPEGWPPYRGPVAGSYDRVHRALARGLATLGLRAGLRGEGRGLASDLEGGSFYCFYHSANPDLQVGNSKLLGSAQRRHGGRVLHHGSLPLDPNPLTPRAACLSVALGRQVELGEVVEALLGGLREGLDLRFREDALSPAERGLARELREKYLSREFTERR